MVESPLSGVLATVQRACRALGDRFDTSPSHKQGNIPLLARRADVGFDWGHITHAAVCKRDSAFAASSRKFIVTSQRPRSSASTDHCGMTTVL
jgi:hypothetical protein